MFIGSSHILPMVLKGSYVNIDKAWVLRRLLFRCKILSIDMMKIVCNWAYFGSLFVFEKKRTCVYFNWVGL